MVSSKRRRAKAKNENVADDSNTRTAGRKSKVIKILCHQSTTAYRNLHVIEKEASSKGVFILLAVPLVLETIEEEISLPSVEHADISKSDKNLLMGLLETFS